MADVMPDYKMEQQRLRMQIAALNHNLERYRFEVMEVESRKAKAFENIAATEKAIGDLETNLAGLAKTHGKLPEIKAG